jgi:drug/metabolite transporter (DMT)-like permease
MTLTAIIILTIAAFTHAGWNLLGKSGSPSPAFFLSANTIGFLTLTPALFIFASVFSLFSMRIWAYLLLAGVFQAVYYLGLARAYHSADMSIAYPLARAIPVLGVALVTSLFGIGATLVPQSVAGMAIVVSGCTLLPMKRFSAFRLSNYANIGTLYAFLAAFGTTGYSIVDDAALRLLRDASGVPADIPGITIVYSFLEGAFTSLWLLLFLSSIREERGRVKATLWREKGKAALTGFTIFLTYTLVLISMSFVSNVSYVVAFRQLSIPIGATIAIVFLKERGYLPRLTGVFLMFMGLVLVGTA